MEAYRERINLRSLGVLSLIFGVLGAVFYFFTPLGIVLGLAGLVIGLVGLTYARRHARGMGLLIGGIVVSCAALILDFMVADFNLEIIQIHALR